MPTREEIHIAFEQGEEVVVALFKQVGKQVEALASQLEKEVAVLQELQARLEQTSQNSHKPPSSDGYKKPPVKRTQSLRKAGQKPNGGQAGHEGHTLQPVAEADHREVHAVEQCAVCGASLAEVEAHAHEERQVFDIPAIRIEVTAHLAEKKICPVCQAENRGVFPEEVKGPVQYGSGVESWAAYFTHQHFVSVERTAEIFEDLVNHRVSEAIILGAGKKLADCVQPATEEIKTRLCGAEVLNVDESGLRVKGKLHWLHVASTEQFTHYEIHEKRGREATEEAGILPNFDGIAIHDHWKPYFGYTQCEHGLCNAHHLRELNYIERQYGQVWAGDMATLLCDIKQVVEAMQEKADRLPPEQIQLFEQRYDTLIEVGYAANPRPPPDSREGQPKKRGRPKQSPPLNLLDRLRDYKPQVLAFMHDFRVPFDNNQAERDVRMVKVKQKVSGSFRTIEGAKHFAQARGYISTARKNVVNIYTAIKNAFAGKPFIPSPDSS